MRPTIDMTDRDEFGPADVAVHFGVVPIAQSRVVHVDQHRDRYSERKIELLGGITLYVSGSWKWWGIDPDAVHDASLHVVAHFTNRDSLIGQVQEVEIWLRANMSGFSRLVDFAIVSQRDDWAEQIATIFVDDNKSIPVILETA